MAFRREDIPGIQPHLRDMVDPAGAAQALGVSMDKLHARQIADPARVPREMVDDFFLRAPARSDHTSPA